MHSQHFDVLLRSLLRLQTSHEYSDLKIFCQDEVFKVHKAIVCPRSQYFATACRWGKDGQPKEEINLPDDDSTLVGLMIDYLYQLDYDDLLPARNVVESAEKPGVEPEVPVGQHVLLHEDAGHVAHTEVSALVPVTEVDLIKVSESGSVIEDNWTFELPKKSKNDKKKRKKKASKLHLQNHVRDLATERLVVNTLMYALADKYAIDDLKMLAKVKFEHAMQQDWNGQSFAYAAELVFTSTHGSDAGLRDIVSRTMNEHRELVNYKEVRKLLDSGNGMAWAFVQALLSNQSICL